MPSAPDFLELIQGQNPGLFTDQWVLRHHQAVGNGTYWRLASMGILPEFWLILTTALTTSLGRLPFRFPMPGPVVREVVTSKLVIMSASAGVAGASNPAGDALADS